MSNSDSTNHPILSKPVFSFRKKDVLTLYEQISISEATKLMQKKDYDEIIIVDVDEKPVGIVTDEDILRKVGEAFVNPQKTSLEDIMRFPVASIDDSSTLSQALEKMRKNKVRKLVTLSKYGTITGIIYYQTIASLMRSAIAYPKYHSSATKSILGNLGFVMQFAGCLIMIPAILSTVLNEVNVATGIFLTSILMIISGFFLNSYGERHDLNLRDMSILVVSSFSLLVVFGMIPYLYLNPYHTNSSFDLVASSFFSSAASFSTAGMSLFPNPEILPQSFTFFRSFTQFVGGLSFIYLIMTAFYPENKLKTMRGFVSGRTPRFKELFGTITIIFTIYTIMIALLLYYFGERNIIDNFSLAMSGLSTGGLIPHSEILTGLLWQEYLVIMSAMILGALPIGFHYGFIRTKFLSPKISKEVLVFFCVLVIGIIIFVLTSQSTPIESVFMAISAGTTAGFQLNDITNETVIPILTLSILMLIGGCGFSTAGGLKIFRLIYLTKALSFFNKEKWKSIQLEENKQIKVALILLVLFPLVPFLVALEMHSFGHDLAKSYFDCIAAITSGGLSMGITDMSLEPSSKILLGVLMIFGRLEIIAIIAIFVPKLLVSN